MMSDNKYIFKRWTIDEIRVRVNNLKKKFGEEYVNRIYKLYQSESDTEFDILYLTYYHIKRRKLKYRINNQMFKLVHFTPKSRYMSEMNVVPVYATTFTYSDFGRTSSYYNDSNWYQWLSNVSR